MESNEIANRKATGKLNKEEKNLQKDEEANKATSEELSRDEIREKRRERRKLKKQKQKLQKEDETRKKLLQCESQKVCVLDRKTFDDIKTGRESTSKTKRKKTVDQKFSLLDFLAIKEKKKRQARNDFLRTNNTVVVKRKGKVKTKKHLTTLKKIIKKCRSMKVEKSPGNKEAVRGGIYVHSNTFRSYCDNTTSPLLSEQTEKLIRKLNEFQRRALQKNEIKAKAHRRFVIGFREVKNLLLIKKLKIVIIATDCEKCDIEGGIDDLVESLKTLSQTDQDIPVCFSMKRRQLAYALYKKVPVSCIGVLSYDGAQDIFHELIHALEKEKNNYVKFFGK